jgi:hypothetical protein
LVAGVGKAGSSRSASTTTARGVTPSLAAAVHTFVLVRSAGAITLLSPIFRSSIADHLQA